MMNIDNHSRCVVCVETSQATNVLLNGEAVPQSAYIAGTGSFYANKGDTITFSGAANHRPVVGNIGSGAFIQGNEVGGTISFYITSDNIFLYGRYTAPEGSKSDPDDLSPVSEK